jgi:hypothetical protein
MKFIYKKLVTFAVTVVKLYRQKHKQMANSISIKKSKIQVKYSAITNKEDDSNMITCVIPAFDICFTANNEEEVGTKSAIMIKAFFEFWLKKQGVKQFGLEIHKLGFRANKMHDAIMKDLINGNRVNSNFSNMKIVNPDGKKQIEFEEELAA